MFSQVVMAKNRLFDERSPKLSNFKICLGGDRDVTSERLADQINRVISQIEAGEYSIVDLGCDND